MNKRKTRKAAYQAIVKEKKTHQETFDALRKTSSLDANTLATEVSNIPSEDKHQSQQALRYIFVGVLILILAIRILGVYLISQETNFNPSMLLVAILIGLIVPITGIVGALTARVELYRIVGLLFIFSTLRSFTGGNMSTEPVDLMVLIPFAIAVGLAFFIPFKMKTNYTTKTIKKEAEGKVITRVEYVFDTTKAIVNDELLDEDMLG